MSHDIPLTLGATTSIQIEVTAADGVTKKTYTMEVPNPNPPSS